MLRLSTSKKRGQLDREPTRSQMGGSETWRIMRLQKNQMQQSCDFCLISRWKPQQTLLRSSPEEGQQCLDQWLLQRAPPLEDCQVNDARGDCQPLDPKHPERWQLDLNKRPHN